MKSPMYSTRRTLFAFICFSLAGCTQPSDTRIAPLEERIAGLEAKLIKLQQQVEMNQMFKEWEGIAFLTPGATGYSLLKSDLGTLTVSLTNVLPYASGSKVALQFGNLSSAAIDGLKAKVEWGPVDKDGTPRNAEAKSRDVVFNESLTSGGWTTAELVLEGVPPTDLGFVRLREVGHRAIRLRRAVGG